MIKINLLPIEERRRWELKPVAPRTPFLVIVVLACLGLVVVGAALLVYKQRREVQLTLARVESQKADYEALIKKQEKKYNNIKQLKEMVTQKLSVLEGLDPEDRILWSEKLYMLAKLIPENVFITEVNIEEKVREIPIPGAEGTRPQIRQFLKLSGITYAPNSHERLRKIVDFYYALKSFSYFDDKNNMRRFMDNFRDNITFSSIVETKLGGVEVKKFSFMLSTRPTVEEIKTASSKEEKKKS